MAQAQPEVGYSAQYFNEQGDEPQAAIICQVNKDKSVNLSVFHPRGYEVIGRQDVLVANSDDLPSTGSYCLVPYNTCK